MNPQCQHNGARCAGDEAIGTIAKAPACAICLREWDNREQSDDQLANRYGVEGGIGYREEDTASYRDAMIDSGRWRG